ncbi:unnamed protein product [Effrenium voratum]|nr:unnamed protein product [Effrenium voratum]
MRWHRVSGYRTPSTASGFVRCWGGSERNSPRRPSYSMSPEERRLSVEGLDEQSRKQVEETKRNLESCIADMALQPISDLRLEKFRPLVTSLTRMERHFRRESPEALIGHLEPKVTVLNFILELHRAKRTYRRQTGSCLNVLLQSRSWFDTFCAHNFHRKAPEDLLNLPALRKPVSLQVPEVKQPEDEEVAEAIGATSVIGPSVFAMASVSLCSGTEVLTISDFAVWWQETSEQRELGACFVDALRQAVAQRMQLAHFRRLSLVSADRVFSRDSPWRATLSPWWRF